LEISVVKATVDFTREVAKAVVDLDRISGLETGAATNISSCASGAGT
jgi:hypothetical protein